MERRDTTRVLRDLVLSTVTPRSPEDLLAELSSRLERPARALARDIESDPLLLRILRSRLPVSGDAAPPPAPKEFLPVERWTSRVFRLG